MENGRDSLPGKVAVGVLSSLATTGIIWFLNQVYKTLFEPLVRSPSPLALAAFVSGAAVTVLAFFLSSRARPSKPLSLGISAAGVLLVISGLVVSLNISPGIIYHTVIKPENISEERVVAIREEPEGLALVIKGDYQNSFLLEIERADARGGRDKLELEGLDQAEEIRNSLYYPVRPGTFPIRGRFHAGETLWINTSNGEKFQGQITLEIIKTNNTEEKR